MRYPVLLLLLTTIACGSDTDSAFVNYRDGRFIAHTEVIIALPPSQVRQILSDYRNLPKVNPGITTVKLLRREPQAGLTRMRVFARACVWFYCRRYNWPQTARQLSSGDIVTVIDPAPHEPSDFRSGTLSYRFRPAGEHTLLLFDAELEPAFWLPPLIGPWVIRHKLLNEAKQTARGVLRIATQ